MTWNLLMYGAGWACLACVFIISMVMIGEALFHNWSRIWPRALGNIILDDAPASPTASVRPLRTCHSRLPVVEADAQPTHSKRVA